MNMKDFIKSINNHVQLFKDLTKKINFYSFSNISIKDIIIQSINFNQFEEKIKSQNLNELIIDRIDFSVSNSIYFLLFCFSDIFIINEINIIQNKEFYRSNSSSFSFSSDQCQNDFNKIINTQETGSFSFEQLNIKKILENKSLIIKVINILITRSQKRTREMHQEMNYSSLTKFQNFNINDFVLLDNINNCVGLYFNVNDQLLYVLKCHDNNHDPNKSFQRENGFYDSICNKNKFISKFFGTIKNNSESNYLVLEYIEGDTLMNYILENEINEIDKIKLILEIIFTVKFIHEKGFFLRDLKYDNIMIDSNKNAILIDFDLTKDIFDETRLTGPVGSECFSSPEQLKINQYSFESDIYSLGMVINFILTRKKYQQRLYDNNGNILNFDIMKEPPSKYWNCKSFKDLFLNCLNYSPNSRLSIDSLIILVLIYLIVYFPEISELIQIIESLHFASFVMKEIPNNNQNFRYCKKISNTDDFDNIINDVYLALIESKNGKENYLNIEAFNNSINKIKNETNSKIYTIQKSIDEKYIDIEYCLQNINEIIMYLNEIDNNQYIKCSNIQYELAKIYYENVIVPRNITKAIFYFQLCAENNHMLAQYHLGVIYNEGKYVSHDINKTIHYFTLAAKNNNKYAQFNLGIIYKSIHNIEKSIHYFSLAAKNDYSDALVNLGYIYFEGTYVTRDIGKSIEYFSRASDLNNDQAQVQLGWIYHYGLYISSDINKAIYYYSLAANQNNVLAQKRLTEIYWNDPKKDISKAVFYLKLAANQNDAEALHGLGYYYYNFNDSRDINKAIHYFTLSANQNYPQAKFMLGFMYDEGAYVKRNINKAINYYSSAANQNFAPAQFRLGLLYFTDKYITKDINKAIYYFTCASNQNIVEAQIILGKIYLTNKYGLCDKERAIYYLTLAANQNFTEAQYILGMTYITADLVSRDINKAIHYLTLAANQNFAEAQFNLGFLYFNGNFIPRDINKAIHFFTLAANQNDVDAQVNLGVIYSDDEYTQPDIKKAIHFLTLAANQNHKEAQYNLGNIYYKSKYIKQDINKAIYFYTLAANQNLARAQYVLGLIYFRIKEVRYIDKSIYYFSLAADQNNLEAQFNLGCIYYNNMDTKRDIKKSIHYFTLAANQQDAESQNNLGKIYLKGKYVPKDIKKAFHYLWLASSRGLPDARCNLAHLYMSEKHDVNKAIHYFELAANQNNRNAQYFLGTYCLYGVAVQQNINKGMNLLNLSSKNGDINAHYSLGFLYLEGKYTTRNIELSLRHFKEASSFKFNFAKNNLGILYKHGFDDKIKKMIGLSIEYFDEAIRQKKDKVSMYNLAHLYLYEESMFKNNIDIIIELLVTSIKIGFSPSKNLLCLALIKAYGFNINYIREKISKYDVIVSSICDMILSFDLLNRDCFEYAYNHYKGIDFLYSNIYAIIESKTIINSNKKLNQIKDPNKKDITNEFYEGFGID